MNEPIDLGQRWWGIRHPRLGEFQKRYARETAHVDPNLGHDHFGREAADTGDDAQHFDGDTKGFDVAVDLLIDAGNGRIHRLQMVRMVREAVRSAVPAQRKKTERPAVKMAAAATLIDAILESDRKAPRKQRHTARRIFDRIRAEVPGCTPAARTVRQYVERRKRVLGMAEHETFVPQSYDWGVEAQVDWYEAYADLDGERVKLQVFEMRSMASGAAFHRAYPCATQQAFLEAHELAFAYFEGVFRRLRYDNLSSAVKKILRGQQRELTTRFISFRSHWRYQAEFCTPGEGHEKGGVEGEGGYFRRNHWVPVPVAADLAALNRKLLEDCRGDESRIVSGQTECVGTRLLTEKEHLRPLAAEPFDLAEISHPRVDQTGCAKVRTNSYSVPLKPGSIVEARVYPTTVEFHHHGNRIANHARCYSRQQKILDLEHYLDVLEMGCADVAAIRHLLQSDQLRHLVGEPIEIGSLSGYERPLPTMIAYDQLLSSCVQAVQA